MPNISQLLCAYGCAGWLVTPAIQQSENKSAMEAGWLMLTAHGIPACKHWKVISRNLRMIVGKMKQWHAMTCPVAPPQKPEHIQSLFFYSQQAEMKTSVSVSVSTYLGALCQTPFTRSYTQPFTSSLIKITTCISRWQLTQSHSGEKPKNGHKHLCVPEGHCALNVFLQPCYKMWPLRKGWNTCRKRIGLKKKTVETLSKCPTSHKALLSFKSPSLLFKVLGELKQRRHVEVCDSFISSAP